MRLVYNGPEERFKALGLNLVRGEPQQVDGLKAWEVKWLARRKVVEYTEPKPPPVEAPTHETTPALLPEPTPEPKMTEPVELPPTLGRRRKKRTTRR